MNVNQVYIFDTTLRDGQQSPGAGMSFKDNLRYAELANLLNIDVLEAGFPSASETDYQIVNVIAKNMAEKNSTMIIAALCQLREEQLVTTMEALQPSLAIKKARVHTYVPVDPNLMQASLGKLADDKNKIIEDLHRLTVLAVKAGFEVEFSPEGYSRLQQNFDFTTDLIRAAVSAGAKVINCPDTIGGAARIEGENYFVRNMVKHADIIKKEFPRNTVIWSAHCHNDFGLALDNSLNAVFEGPARQIEGCINGVGERAGNVSLEQCIIYIKNFGKYYDAKNPLFTSIKCEYLKKASDFISERMLPRQPHSPIVGENATRHSSGGHTNAILKNPLAYQPFDPAEIGSKITLVFGPLSGSNHAKQIIEAHGYSCTNEEKTDIAQAIKNFYADRRKGITDAQLMHAYLNYRAPIKVKDIFYSKTSRNQSTLTLTGKFFDKETININYQGANSALAALGQAVENYLPGISIFDYRSNSVDERSINAKCYSKIIIQTTNGEQFIGQATDEDIAISALTAYVDAVNKAYVAACFRIETN